ncbi:MAG: MFS transporter [Burkholderiaceae bacterium]
MSERHALGHSQSVAARHPYTVLLAWVTLGLATLVGMSDSAVNVALPAITESFGIALGDIQWIITIYVLAQSSLTITFGKIADRYGYRPVLMTGLAISALALLLCSLATHYPTLVGLRFAQGIGVGLILATSPAIASFLMPAAQQRQAMAYYTMWLALGLCLGPLVGGLLVSSGGWPGVFWVRTPIALLALIIVWRLTFIGHRGDQSQTAGSTTATAATRTIVPGAPPGPKPRADIAGAAWMVAALSALVLFLVLFRQSTWGWWSPTMALFICLASLIRFWQTELRAPDPIVDVSLFRHPTFRHLQIAAVFTNLAAFSIFLIAPYLFVQWPGFSVIDAGLLLALYPFGMLLAGFVSSVSSFSSLSSRLANRLTAHQLIIAGMLLLATGLALCAGFSLTWTLPGMGFAMVLCGLGHGCFQVGHLDATLSAMPVADRGVAGSIVAVGRLLGIVLAANGLLWLHETMADSNLGFAVQYAKTFMFCSIGITGYCLIFWASQRRSVRNRRAQP